MYDIVIIGAGVAGLTAGIYAKRANKTVLILEKKSYGGQIINASNIENYPGEEHISGFDLATKLYNQNKSLGVDIFYEEAKNVKKENKEFIIETNKNTYRSKALIIATGTNNRKMNLTNEDNLIGKGISYCATCDGNFYKNKVVAVVGGGNTALEDALYLSNICKKVYLIHRRDKFRADSKTVEELSKKDNIEVILNSNVTNLIGNDHLEMIEVTSNDKKNNLEVAGLFIAIGQIPESELLNGKIEIDESNYIISNENCHTNIEGAFVAGDVRQKNLRQLVTATSDGAIAATEAINYINKDF